ncbi:MAG: prolipoprotein diacylglyceryl transferase [Bacteroidetes bacterium]|nr:prolipoprotein diacylglyceryl transferase [Bacteroidota bacterium]
MGTLTRISGKLSYGLLFMLVLPLALWLWARSTEPVIRIPVPDLPIIGLCLSIAGGIICLWGMFSLVWYGKGLPMNAYPPTLYVHKGIYAVFKHPIYWGSGAIAFGISLFFKSSSGFWMVSPLFCLAMAAFVAGFENEKIKNAKGYFPHKTFFSLPDKSTAAPATADRLNIFILVLAPWAILYELFVFIGLPKDVIYTNLAFERQLPVIEWSEIFYELPYIMALLVPFVLNTKLQVRGFIQDAWWAMGFVFFAYIVFPFAVYQRDFTPTNALGRLIYWERRYDGGIAAFPSFHVVWAFFIAKYFSAVFRLKTFWYALAVIISLSCIANGSHSFADVIAGALIYLLADRRHAGWNNIKHLSEKIANSWREWHWGQARLINHGLYAGASAVTGMMIVESCLGKDHAFTGIIIAIAAIAGAALWAQIVEGSPSLLRPYGYYGSIVGGIISTLFISLVHNISIMYLLAAFALAAPWFQMLGRLRCLVQGCCHGKPCDAVTGIRFTAPQSRVLKIAALKGVPVHPTQLYSIGSNLIIALLLIRLVSLQMPVQIITGLYFLLNGIARFVEESLRGEPQTVYWKGLRLYQWLAVISIVAGAAITCIPAVEHLLVHVYPGALIFALILGLIATAAYGLDFPKSNRRFARLTS